MENAKKIVPQIVLDRTIKFNELSEDSSSYYHMVYFFAKENCDILDVTLPDICIWDELLFDEVGTHIAAYTFSKHDYDLDNDLIVLSGPLCFYNEEASEKLAYAVVAHEMRHLWQYKNLGYKKNNNVCYDSPLTDIRDIDADAYAMALTSLTIAFTDIETAASLICPRAFFFDYNALIIRTKLAERLQAEIKKRRAEKHGKK